MQQGLTNALKKVLEGKAKKLYFVQGHGEHDPSASEPEGYSGIESSLKSENFEVAKVTLAQEGKVPDDATVLVGCCVSDGHVFLIDHWQRPVGLDSKLPWVVPRDEVDASVDRAFDRWRVRAFSADPGSGEDESGERFWDGFIDGWGIRHGDDLVIKATVTALQPIDRCAVADFKVSRRLPARHPFLHHGADHARAKIHRIRLSHPC